MRKLGLLVWRRKSFVGDDPIKISSASLGILPLTVGAFMQDTESLQRLGCLLLFVLYPRFVNIYESARCLAK